MKNFLQDFGAAVDQTGGLLLLVAFPMIPILLIFGGLQAVGRSYWGKGANAKSVEAAKAILAKPRYPGDDLEREIAQRIINVLG